MTQGDAQMQESRLERFLKERNLNHGKEWTGGVQQKLFGKRDWYFPATANGQECALSLCVFVSVCINSGSRNHRLKLLGSSPSNGYFEALGWNLLGNSSVKEAGRGLKGNGAGEGARYVERGGIVESSVWMDDLVPGQIWVILEDGALVDFICIFRLVVHGAG